VAQSRSPASKRARIWSAALLALALLCATRTSARAGPWLPEPGRVYIELRELFSTTAQGFAADGHRRSLHTLTDDGASVATRFYEARSRVYAEIGLATRLALVADLVLLDMISMPREGGRARAATGVGDLDAGVRLQLFDEEVACALQVTLGIPTGHADEAQPLGTGDLRGQLVLSFGKIWERTPIFFTAELGARIRSSGTQRSLAAGLPPTDPLSAPDTTRSTINYASELLYGLELGYLWRVSERVRITPRLTLDGRHGLTAPVVLAIDPVAPTSVRLLRLGASIGVGRELRSRGKAVARLELHVGGGAFVWGQGLPAAGEVTVAVGLSR